MTKEAAFAEALYSALPPGTRVVPAAARVDRARRGCRAGGVHARLPRVRELRPCAAVRRLDHEDRPQPLPRPAAPADDGTRACSATKPKKPPPPRRPGEDGLGAVLGAERAAAVNAAVAKLPERYRVPLAFAYYADADYDEIATSLGITRTHVGVLLCRAKQLLRQCAAMQRRARGNAMTCPSPITHSMYADGALAAREAAAPRATRDDLRRLPRTHRGAAARERCAATGATSR